jgi:hypothetical protein
MTPVLFHMVAGRKRESHSSGCGCRVLLVMWSMKSARSAKM